MVLKDARVGAGRELNRGQRQGLVAVILEDTAQGRVESSGAGTHLEEETQLIFLCGLRR